MSNDKDDFQREFKEIKHHELGEILDKIRLTANEREMIEDAFDDLRIKALTFIGND